jgi:hypothetical protein
VSELTHLGEDGRARMVEGDGPKGEVLGVVRIAGVQAAKQTATLIPLSHPLPLSFVDLVATVTTWSRGVIEIAVRKIVVDDQWRIIPACATAFAVPVPLREVQKRRAGTVSLCSSKTPTTG